MGFVVRLTVRLIKIPLYIVGVTVGTVKGIYPGLTFTDEERKAFLHQYRLKVAAAKQATLDAEQAAFLAVHRPSVAFCRVAEPRRNWRLARFILRLARSMAVFVMVKITNVLKRLIGPGIVYHQNYMKERFPIQGYYGFGTTGTIYRCISLSSGKEVAIKVIPYKSEDDIMVAEQVREGLQLPQGIKGCLSNNTAFLRPDSLSFVLEACPRGNLAKNLYCYLAKPYTPGRARDTIASLLRGLSHLHDAGLAHMDVQPKSILFRGDGFDNVCLTHFQHSTAKWESRRITCRSYGFMAREALLVAAKGRGSFVSWQADIFSAGITALQLLGGQVPLEKMLPESDNFCFFDLGFELYGDAEVMEAFISTITNYVDGDCRPLLRRLLNPNPADRPSASTALQDEYFGSTN